MTHIRYLSAILFISILCFYLGVDVGLDKMGMHRIAGESWGRIESLKYHSDMSSELLLQRELEFEMAKQSDALIAYGKYLSSFAYHVPSIDMLDAITESSIKDISEKVLDRDPEFFEKMNAYYDLVIEEFKESDDLLVEDYSRYKKQLKLVENKFKK